MKYNDIIVVYSYYYYSKYLLIFLALFTIEYKNLLVTESSLDAQHNRSIKLQASLTPSLTIRSAAPRGVSPPTRGPVAPWTVGPVRPSRLAPGRHREAVDALHCWVSSSHAAKLDRLFEEKKTCCGAPAFHTQLYSLTVQWVKCLLPAEGAAVHATGGAPAFLELGSPISDVLLNWWPRHDPWSPA